jgi:hypothetical protein
MIRELTLKIKLGILLYQLVSKLGQTRKADPPCYTKAKVAETKDKPEEVA